MEKRIAELEVKLSFCEDMLEELNNTVYRQQQQIHDLQRETKELREQIRLSLPGDRTPGEEKPPHY